MKNLKKFIGIALAAAFFAPTFQSCIKGEDDPALSLRSRTARLAGEWSLASMEMMEEETVNYSDPNANSSGDVTNFETSSQFTWDGSTLNVSSSSTTTYDDGDRTTYEYSTSGGVGTQTYTSTSGGTTTTNTFQNEYTGSVMSTLTIERDGTFQMTWEQTTTTVDTSSSSGYDYTNTNTIVETRTVSGTWAWLSEDKTNDIGDKQRVAFFFSDFDEEEEDTEEEVYVDKDANDFYDWTQDNETTVTTDRMVETGSDTEPDMVWNITMLKNKEMDVEMTYSYDRDGTYTVATTSGGTTVTSTTTETRVGTESGMYSWTQE